MTFFIGMEYQNHLLALLDGAWMIRHEAGVVVHLLLHDPLLLLDRLDRLAGDAADVGIFLTPLLLSRYNCS